MVNIEQDTKELVWAIQTFQQCVPEKYRAPIEILIAKYYTAHPSDEAIRKIVSILVNPKEVDEKVKFVKEEL